MRPLFPLPAGLSDLLRAATVALGTSLAIASAGFSQAAPPTCRTDITEHVRHRLEYLQELVTSPDIERVDMRRRLGIAAAPGVRVTLIGDGPRCQQAVAALNARLKDRSQEPIWLYDAGSCFAVDDPNANRLGSEGVLFLFDRRFVRRTAVVGIQPARCQERGA